METLDQLMGEGSILQTKPQLDLWIHKTIEHPNLSERIQWLQGARERLGRPGLEEQLGTVCLHLANALVESQQISDAIMVLMNIPDRVSETRRLELLLKLAHLQIQCHLLDQAEQSLSRAALLSQTDIESLTYAQAVLADRRHNYSLAASKFALLAQHCDQYLSSAIICTVLSSSSPQRTRLMTSLSKHPSLASVPEYARLLECMLRGKLIRNAQDFLALFQPHHLALNENGLSAWQRAVLEHNVLSASQRYSSIRMGELAILLNIDQPATGTLVAQMIIEKRLKASIDQVDGLIHFETPATLTQKHRIASLCQALDHIVQQVKN